MRPQLSLDQSATSVLFLATFGWLMANFASARAENPPIVPSDYLIKSSLNVIKKTDLLPSLKPADPNPVYFFASSENKQASIDSLAQSTTTKIPAKNISTDDGTLPSETTDSDQALPGTEDDLMEQITSVSQLRDVQPTDWAFQALQSLVERYGCIAGYPDGSFRGNKPMSRYEFAAGLNACMDKVNQLIQSSSANRLKKDDLVSLQRLQEEFAAELASLRGRVDSLEARNAELKAHQFSPTTKLFGQAIFGIQTRNPNRADFFPVDGHKDTKDPGTNTNMISNVQLSLFTQLSPRSLLLTGIQMGSGSTAPRLSNDSRLAYEGDTQNQLVISDLNYRQLIGNKLALIVGPAGVSPVNVFRGANRVESAGQGPISALAQRNAILNIGNGRGGIGLDWQIIPRISMQAVYSASTPQDPTNGGISGGPSGQTTEGVQFNFAPTDTVDLALDYIHSYSPPGVLGTGLGDDQLTTVNTPLKTHAFGGTLEWRVSPKFTLGTWGGYTTSSIPKSSGSVETTNWMVFANFPDLFGRGNLGGIYVGQPPKIIDSDLPLGKNIPNLLAGGPGKSGGEPGTTTHVEAFYRFRVTDNISITPGVLVIFNPGHTPASDTITIGALRTTFTF